MKPEQQPIILLLPTRLFPPAIAHLLATAILLCFPLGAEAGSAEWKEIPTDGNWNTSRNWIPRTVPNGVSDVASFGVSSLTNIALSAPVEVASMVFQPGATSFSISDTPTVSLTMSGTGIQNDSGVTHTFIALPGDFDTSGFNFVNGASAGSGVAFDLQGGTFSGEGGGVVKFFGNASAGEASFALHGPTDIEAGAGSVTFFDSSTADNSSFISNTESFGGSPFAQFRGTSTAASAVFSGNGLTWFLESANAGSSTITVDGSGSSEQPAGTILMMDGSSAGTAHFIGFGGEADFQAGASFFFAGSADAANASLVANGELKTAGGATIYFEATSTGGSCGVEVNGRGTLDVSLHDAPGLTIGSLQGDGSVFLGANNLAVGSDDSDSTFSGTIHDGGANGGSGASLTKIGAGTLTLSGANVYTGSTTISAGTLLVNAKGDSATGMGPVQVGAGRLAGTGVISGAVTIGTGNGPGASISPGANGPGRLGIRKSLSFEDDSIYLCQISTSKQKADQISAKGVVIGSGALFSFLPMGNQAIPEGTVFVVLNNSSRNLITGTFNNLPDASTFTLGLNRYQVSYEGGTGNDLTLTVMP